MADDAAAGGGEGLPAGEAHGAEVERVTGEGAVANERGAAAGGDGDDDAVGQGQRRVAVGHQGVASGGVGRLGVGLAAGRGGEQGEREDGWAGAHRVLPGEDLGAAARDRTGTVPVQAVPAARNRGVARLRRARRRDRAPRG